MKLSSSTLLAAVMGALVLGAVVARAEPAGLSKSCPSAAIVNAALGQKNTAPRLTRSTYATICTYHGRGIVPTRITFQVDTATTFAASEKAVSALGILKITGLGKGAWAPKVGGGLYVFTGSQSIKILSPLTSLTKLESLVRKLL